MDLTSLLQEVEGLVNDELKVGTASDAGGLGARGGR